MSTKDIPKTGNKRNTKTKGLKTAVSIKGSDSQSNLLNLTVGCQFQDSANTRKIRWLIKGNKQGTGELNETIKPTHMWKTKQEHWGPHRVMKGIAVQKPWQTSCPWCCHAELQEVLKLPVSPYLWNLPQCSSPCFPLGWQTCQSKWLHVRTTTITSSFTRTV